LVSYFNWPYNSLFTFYEKKLFENPPTNSTKIQVINVKALWYGSQMIIDTYHTVLSAGVLRTFETM